MRTEDILKKGAHPVRVAQFGTGNFLRAFVDQMIDEANEKDCFDADVVMIKQVPGSFTDRLAAQGGKYHVVFQGKSGGKVVDDVREITCVRGTVNPYEDYDAYKALACLDTLRFVVSNTTETGIVYDESDRFDSLPAASYPGRLVQFLYERWKHFDGDISKGLIILPVELIENNGGVLKDCVLRLAARWQLGQAFTEWIENANVFCSTLVDRIVSGKPAGMSERFPGDSMYVVAEPMGLWVIESERDISEEFPLDKADMPLVFTSDLRPYRECKVRLLNGTHTAMALISYLCGVDIVADAMGDPLLRRYIDRVSYGELLPAVPMPEAEAREFADKVMERFENPFLGHKLLDISLNSVSKWKARDLPSLRDNLRAGRPSPCLIFSLAALLAFDTAASEHDGQIFGLRPDGGEYPIREDKKNIDAVQIHSADDAKRVLADTNLWGEDLSDLSGDVYKWLEIIRRDGPRAALEELLK